MQHRHVLDSCFRRNDKEVRRVSPASGGLYPPYNSGPVGACRGPNALCVFLFSPKNGGSRGIGPGDEGGGFGIRLEPPYNSAKVMKEVQEKIPAGGLGVSPQFIFFFPQDWGPGG